jgi:hypothetical protein
MLICREIIFEQLVGGLEGQKVGRLEGLKANNFEDLLVTE